MNIFTEHRDLQKQLQSGFLIYVTGFIICNNVSKNWDLHSFTEFKLIFWIIIFKT